MPRYIDADDLKAVIHANDWSNPVVPDVVGVIIDRSPTADVVEVVRCKDCIYNHIGNCMFSKEITPDYDPEYYCAGGERIEDGSE